MPAGTIALTNNSATVTGTGTSFTTEFKVGDFVGVIVGSAPYTMVVASIASNTQLTLSVPFNGPSASGLAWYAVPASLKIAISQQILNDIGTNARGMILQMDNWQKIYSDAASVTVTRTDRSTFTGPSWGFISAQFNNMLTKGDNLASIENKSTARSNLGLKSAATYDAIGTVTNGNAIIESGSNSNGSYIKFIDGTMICWGNSTTVSAATGAFGALFVGTIPSLAFPAAFVGNVPRVAVASRYGGSSSLAWAAINAVSTAAVNLNVIGSVSGSTTIGDYIAIGRWKA